MTLTNEQVTQVLNGEVLETFKANGKLTAELALCSVLAERVRQDARWGVQDHDPFTWNSVLMEEVGEWNSEALHVKFGPPFEIEERMARMRTEAVQVAAVALAIVECIDRGNWEWLVKAEENL